MTDQQRAANPMGSGGREGDLLQSLPVGHVIHTLAAVPFIKPYSPGTVRLWTAGQGVRKALSARHNKLNPCRHIQARDVHLRSRTVPDGGKAARVLIVRFRVFPIA